MMKYLFFAIGLIFPAVEAEAKVFHSKEGAMRLAFPGADKIQAKHLFLDDAQLKTIEQNAGEAPPSKIVTVYIGQKQGVISGYAFIDTHTVRTLPETFMTVIDPSGRVRAVHVLAFHEPQEYLPPQGWLKQFETHRLSSTLQMNRDIAGIAGATLSAHAVTRATRRILAVHAMFFGKPSPVAMRKP